MIVHVVMWKINDGADKASNAARVVDALQALPSKIDVIQKLSAGINTNTSDAAWDVSLYTEFETWQDLETYQKHPEHVKVAELIGKLRSDRAVVDYEA